jgi:hypothetical protein
MSTGCADRKGQLLQFASDSVQTFSHFRSSLELRKIAGLRWFVIGPKGASGKSGSGTLRIVIDHERSDGKILAQLVELTPFIVQFGV